jgi:hypothetical protein
MTTQQEIDNSAAKHIVGIFGEILSELRGVVGATDTSAAGALALWNAASLLTIASVLDQQGDTHTDSFAGIMDAVGSLPQAEDVE